MQRMSCGWRTEVRIREPDCHFENTRNKMELDRNMIRWHRDLQKHWIPLPDYLRQMRGFLELAIDRGLLGKAKSGGSGKLSAQQKAMFCALLEMMGLNFDSHLKAIAAVSGSPWGSEPLPLGYVDGSAFHGRSEQTADETASIAVFPSRLRLSELRQRAKEAMKKRRGVSGQHVVINVDEQLVDEEDALSVMVLPSMGNNPHALLERAGGGTYRGAAVARSPHRHHRRRSNDDDDDAEEKDARARGKGSKRVCRSRADDHDDDGEGGESRARYADGTYQDAVGEGATKTSTSVSGAGGDGGGHSGRTKVPGVFWIYRYCSLFFVRLHE